MFFLLAPLFYRKEIHYDSSRILESIQHVFLHHLKFFDNQPLRQEYEKTNSTSALNHMIKLIQDWEREGVPILLNTKNQTGMKC